MRQVCIWDYYGQQKHALMDNMEKTLDDSNIQMDQEVGIYDFCASILNGLFVISARVCM